MKPDEALLRLEDHGSLGVPRIHTELPSGTLQRLAERLLVTTEKRREIQHPVSHVPESEAPESANINKDLDEATRRAGDVNTCPTDSRPGPPSRWETG